MERMKIYTRTGDKGSTGLFGGQRVPKSSLHLSAYGTLDELNSVLGIVTADPGLPKDLKTQLLEIQSLLFQLGADLATPLTSKANVRRMDGSFATVLEQWIDKMEATLTPLASFILPGGSVNGAYLHQARTVCRRAERAVVELSEQEPITEAVIIIVNRLSDYLFVAARYINKESGTADVIVEIPKN